MEVFVADEVEGKAVFSLDCETEQSAGREDYAEVRIISPSHLHCNSLKFNNNNNWLSKYQYKVHLLHVNPLPMKPLLHVHVGWPPDGVHEAFGSQGLGLQGSVEKRKGYKVYSRSVCIVAQ